MGLREARLAVPLDRDTLLGGQQFNWLEYFAFPARTVSAAKEALKVLPSFPPILERADRTLPYDSRTRNRLRTGEPEGRGHPVLRARRGVLPTPREPGRVRSRADEFRSVPRECREPWASLRAVR